MSEKTMRPVIVDMGKVKRKHIKRLKRYRGRLVGEVDDVVRTVRADGGEEIQDATIVPIVIVYRRKRKKRKGGFRFPMMF